MHSLITQNLCPSYGSWRVAPRQAEAVAQMIILAAPEIGTALAVTPIFEGLSALQLLSHGIVFAGVPGSTFAATALRR